MHRQPWTSEQSSQAERLSENSSQASCASDDASQASISLVAEKMADSDMEGQWLSSRHSTECETDGWLLSDPMGAWGLSTSTFAPFDVRGSASAEASAFSWASADADWVTSHLRESLQAPQDGAPDQEIDWLVSDVLGDEPVGVPSELIELLSTMGVAGLGSADASSTSEANAELLVQELLRIQPELDLEVAACTNSAIEDGDPTLTESVAATELGAADPDPAQPAVAEPTTAKPKGVEVAALTEAEIVAVENSSAESLVGQAAAMELAGKDDGAAELASQEFSKLEAQSAESVSTPATQVQQQAIASIAEKSATEATWEEQVLDAFTSDFCPEIAEFLSPVGSKGFQSCREVSLEERIVAALDLLAKSPMQEKMDTKDFVQDSGAKDPPIELGQRTNIFAAFEQREEGQKEHPRTSQSASAGTKKVGKPSAHRKSRDGEGKITVDKDVLKKFCGEMSMEEVLRLQSRRKKKERALPQLGGVEAEDEEKPVPYAKRALRLIYNRGASPPPMYQPYRRSAMDEDLDDNQVFYDSDLKDACHKSQRIPYAATSPGWSRPPGGQRVWSASAPPGADRLRCPSSAVGQRLWSASSSPVLSRPASRPAAKPPGLLPDIIKAPEEARQRVSGLVQSGLATVLGQSLSAPALHSCGKVMPGGLAYSSKAMHGLYEKKCHLGSLEVLHMLKDGRLPQMILR